MSDQQPATPGHVERARRVLEGVLGVPATEGNAVTVLRNGDQIFPAMLDAITASRHTIDFLTFVYWRGHVARRFAEALASRAEAGVRVRVLLDAVGARLLDDELVQLMTGAGCDVRWFRPAELGAIGEVTNRTHRKVLVCDERVSFTGGVGIAEEWEGDARDETEWRDTHFRLEGPATDGLRAAFLDNWLETGDPVFDPGVDRFPDQPEPGGTVVQVITGAAGATVSDVMWMFRALLELASERVHLTTAYFTPDDELVVALCDARDRGVEVRILVPGPHADKRFVQLAGEAEYERLMEHGIEICMFMPSMLHAKVLTVDGRIAAVGSANFNTRSTSHDDEVNLVVLDPAVVSVLDDQFEDDLRRAERVDPAVWEERGLLQRLGEKATGVISDLM